MIDLLLVFKVHDLVIEAHGGAKGIKDKSALDIALARPFQSFDGFDLYKTAIEKAPAIGESIIINLPFVDGNKRTGLVY